MFSMLFGLKLNPNPNFYNFSASRSWDLEEKIFSIFQTFQPLKVWGMVSDIHTQGTLSDWEGQEVLEKIALSRYNTIQQGLGYMCPFDIVKDQHISSLLAFRTKMVFYKS